MRQFPRTFHALDDERPGVSLVGLVLVSLLLAGWLTWLFAARISVFEVTPLGRLEVDRAAYPIASQVDGKVTEMPMTVGGRVEVGDLLVQLDTQDLEIRLLQDEARLASTDNELEAVRQELGLRRRTLEENRQASRLALEEARTRLREAEIEAGFADEEAERSRVLFEGGQVSQMEADRKRSEAARLRESVKTLSLTAQRQEAELRTRELADRTELAQLSRTLAQLEGDSAATAVDIEETHYELDKRSIRAPRAGKVGELADLRVMSTVREGEPLGTLLAEGDIKVLADFAAASALGRVRLGQQARMRLDGFPWTQYGMLSATVDRVASEPRSGRLRVELEVAAASDLKVPLQHGLTGTVEVEVERISPAALLLRTLGKALRPKPLGPEGDAAVRSGAGGSVSP